MALLSRRLPLLRKVLASLTLLATVVSQPVVAFDTFWHSADTSAAGKQLGFTDDAINIVQFGNFSGPDFFGPLYDTVLGERIEGVQPKMEAAVKAVAEQMLDFRMKPNTQTVRKMAAFMHFDNIHGRLDANWKFDYLFLLLLKNTQTTISGFYKDSSIPPGHKRLLVLMTLGGSMHVVQDFYSHSDWTHQDFQKLGFSLVRMPWGKDRDPTWFEVRAKLGDPANWPFKVCSGVYPPPRTLLEVRDTWLGSPMTHTAMNHDNSQLFYDKKPQEDNHRFGPFPTKPGDDAAIREHQLFAANTAAGASIEWIQKVMEDPVAKEAINAYKGTKFAKNDATLTFLTQALGSMLFMSCVAAKWDGDKPPARRQKECYGMYLVAGGAAPADLMPGVGVPGFYGGIIPSPYSLLWGLHVKYNIVEHLTKDFGSQSGDYNFDYSWWKTQRP
jgi:hypothetical protein